MNRQTGQPKTSLTNSDEGKRVVPEEIQVKQNVIYPRPYETEREDEQDKINQVVEVKPQTLSPGFTSK